MRKTRTVLALIFSLALLWLAFRDIDFSHVFSIISSLQYRYFLWAIFFDLFIFIFKSFKWRAIFLPVKKLEHTIFFSGIAIGSMSNNLLPFRLAELVRVFYLSWKSGVKKAVVFGTIVIERTIDIFTLLLALLSLSLLFYDEQWIRESCWIIALGFITLSLVILIIIKHRERAFSIIERIFSNKYQNFKNGILSLYNNFTEGLNVIPGKKQFFMILLFSWSEWIAALICTKFFLSGFGLVIPWKGLLLLVVANNVSSAIPSAPSSIGVFEFFIKYSLVRAFSIDPDTALSFALVLHFVMVAPISIIGIVFLFRDGLSLSNLKNLRKEQICS